MQTLSKPTTTALATRIFPPPLLLFLRFVKVVGRVLSIFFFFFCCCFFFFFFFPSFIFCIVYLFSNIPTRPNRQIHRQMGRCCGIHKKQFINIDRGMKSLHTQQIFLGEVNGRGQRKGNSEITYFFNFFLLFFFIFFFYFFFGCFNTFGPANWFCGIFFFFLFFFNFVVFFFFFELT